jgi:hypothetical protein
MAVVDHHVAEACTESGTGRYRRGVIDIVVFVRLGIGVAVARGSLLLLLRRRRDSRGTGLSPKEPIACLAWALSLGRDQRCPIIGVFLVRPRRARDILLAAVPPSC